MFIKDGNLVVTQRVSPDLNHRHLPARITTQRIAEELGGLVWAEASRGCDWHCTFCSVKELHKSGFKGDIPIDSIVRDLQRLQQMGVNLVSFTDDDFCGGGIERTMQLAQTIMEQVPGIQYTISTRADHIFAERPPRHLKGQISLEEYNYKLLQMVQLLAQSGLVRVFIGLESGSPSQLRRYGKQISVEANYRAIQILRDHGIDVVAGYIPIDPLMDLQELRENLQFLRQTGMYLKITNPLSVLRVQAGSPYLKLLEHRNLLGDQTSDLVFYEASFENPAVQEIAELANQWVTDLYSLVFGLKSEAARNASNSYQDPTAQLAQRFLYQLRELEMKFLEALTETKLQDPSASLDSIVSNFIQRRSQVVQQIRDSFQAGAFQTANPRLKEAILQLTS